MHSRRRAHYPSQSRLQRGAGGAAAAASIGRSGAYALQVGQVRVLYLATRVIMNTSYQTFHTPAEC